MTLPQATRNPLPTPDEKSDLPELRRLDFGLIREQFDSLRIAMANKIEREWPGKSTHDAEGGRALILGLYKGAENALGAVRFLVADSPPNPARYPEYALTTSPIVRSILDALCSTVFLFGNFNRRVDWYYRAGWRELVEETERYRAAYGGDDEWEESLEERASLIERGRKAFGITDDEASGKTPIKRWPIPERMLSDFPEDSDRYRYIRYLIDWFYRTLSQDAHHSWTGLARAYPFLLKGQVPEEQRQHGLKVLRTRQVHMSLTLMMALITEIELELGFGLSERAKYVWTILRDWSDEATEVYDRFYKNILGPANAGA